MKLHPRHEPTTKAGIDIQVAVNEAVREYDLTHNELTQILAQIILSWNKYAIRDERAENESEREDSKLEGK